MISIVETHKYLKRDTSMDLKTIVANTKNIYMTDSNLSMLLDFERVIDEVDMYAFKNWINGELAAGPIVEKYWVTCSFIYPYKLMPDPTGGARLLDYNCKVSYEEDYLTYPKKIEGPDDFDPGTKKAKAVKKKVWVVTIRMPKDLLTDIKQGFTELEGETVDTEAVDKAYEEDIGDMDIQANAEPAVEEELDLDLGI